VRSHLYELGLLGVLACVLGAAWMLDPAFVARDVQLGLSAHAAELTLLALAMTFVVLSGGIDLSVGSAMGLATVAMGMLCERGVPVWGAAAAAVFVGAAAGALNGVFVARVRVHPLIVTLATLAAYRGLAEGISLGRPISEFPDTFLRLGSGDLAGVPIPVCLAIVAAGVAMWTASSTAWGRSVYALGGNETAARYAGLRTDRVKLSLYALSGLAAGMAAVVFVARRSTAKADVGAGMELEAITAVVLGGTSIFGGRGSVLGTLLGVVIIHEIREFVSWHWQKDEVILLVTGGILIGSVLVNNAACRVRR
jgi:rhamnose transport system permease protein